MTPESRKYGHLIYLASPYSDPDKSVMEERFNAACKAAGEIFLEGHMVFSPIAHTHPIAKAVNLPQGFDFYADYDYAMLTRCDELIVLRLTGWEESRGVQEEIKMANKLGLPVRYL